MMRYEIGLILRLFFAIALLISLPFGFNIFQTAFEELTLKSTVIYLNMADANPNIGFNSVRYSVAIMGGTAVVDIVKDCVTASAYYLFTLLAILALGIPLWKRLLLLLIGYAAIFAMNMARIIILIRILLENDKSFSTWHTALGLILSLVFVIILWVVLAAIFKIKNIPVVSDYRLLLKEAFRK